MFEDFAKTAAEILAGNGIKRCLYKKDTPTLVVAYSVVHFRLSVWVS
jgi:phosphomannomutase